MREIYPALDVNLGKIQDNAKRICHYCEDRGISVAGVIKFSDGDLKVAKSYLNGGCRQLASSRMVHLRELKTAFEDVETMLIRIPMISEAEDVVLWADYSLNSEVDVLEVLNREALEAGKTHKVILMYDAGDRREGITDGKELLELALKVENEMEGLYLAGIGSSFACMSGVVPDENNLKDLAKRAEEIEKAIGRKLDMVSGGSSITLMALDREVDIPEKINHLRIGGAIANPMGLRINRGVVIEGMWEDGFILTAEVVEVKEKSAASGSSGKNWAGQAIEIEDVGVRRRAIVAVGSQDIGDGKQLVPLEEKMKVIGGSSDHTLIDVTDCDGEVKPGDRIQFKMFYMPLLYAFSTRHIRKNYI